MNLFLLFITITFCYFLFKNFGKTIVLISFTVALMNYLNSGIANIRMFYLLTLFSIPCYIIFNKKYPNKYPLPLLIASFFTSFCYLMTDYHSEYKETALIIVNLSTYFIFPFILYKVLNNKERINFAIKCFLLVFLFASVYTIIEGIIQSNPISIFMKEFDMTDGVVAEETSQRFGISRCFSIFSYSSTLGYLSAAAFYITYFLKYEYQVPIYPRIQTLLIFLLPLCVILSGTRSQMLAFMIGFISVILHKNIFKNIYLRYITVIVIITLPMLLPFIENILDATFKATDDSGSTTELREAQLEISLYYFNRSPIWGNGRMYLDDIVRPENPAILGAESIWFPLLINFGTMGCVSFILLIICTCIFLYKIKKIYVFFPIMFLVSKTVSIVIGVEFYTLLIFSILIAKIHLLYKSQKHT